MILAIDIGNTTVGMSIINNDRIIASEKCMTDISETEINYHDKISRMLLANNVSKIEGAIISSVVPIMTEHIKNIIALNYGITPLLINHKTSCGIDIITDEPEKVGSDRIADAVGGVSEYGAPLIIIDMGTATTISIVNNENKFMGGIILPGVSTALNALIKNTAQLPQIKLASPPESIIGTNTVNSIESGMLYGTAAAIDGICERIFLQLGYKPKIIATGGNSGKIIPLCHNKIIIDKYLIMKGLSAIYKKHKENTDA